MPYSEKVPPAAARALRRSSHPFILQLVMSVENYAYELAEFTRSRPGEAIVTALGLGFVLGSFSAIGRRRGAASAGGHQISFSRRSRR